MAINTSSYARALQEGVHSWFQMARTEHPEQYSRIFEVKKSRKAFEEVMQYTGLGMLSAKSEGGSVAYEDSKQGWLSRFNHVTYGLGFIVTLEAMEDDLYDVIAETHTKALGKSVRITKETIAANVLNRASNTAYGGGDGSSLLASAAYTDTSHPFVGGGSFTNAPAAGTDLSEAALEDACVALGKFTDDKGLRSAVMPKQLIIPVDSQFEAERILNTDMRVATADNDLNAIKSLGKIPGGFVVNNYITDTDMWLVQTDAENGLCWFDRRPESFTQDNDHDTDNLKYKATFRASAYWSNPQCVYGSMGA
ncbi:MAG: Mu-like prophage major head subunit gpT family protein [Gammaproteobacteria bacterium]|nr:Mu-like prophage major head subunit gpT family protein [Gammaproteobacteria bacterium]